MALQAISRRQRMFNPGFRRRIDGACRNRLRTCTIPKMPAKKLTKSALLQRIAQETDTDRRTAAFFLEVLTDIALAEVKKNGEFTLPGIGKLVKQRRKARMGRNPKTGESIKIA